MENEKRKLQHLGMNAFYKNVGYSIWAGCVAEMSQDPSARDDAKAINIHTGEVENMPLDEIDKSADWYRLMMHGCTPFGEDDLARIGVNIYDLPDDDDEFFWEDDSPRWKEFAEEGYSWANYMHFLAALREREAVSLDKTDLG